VRIYTVSGLVGEFPTCAAKEQIVPRTTLLALETSELLHDADLAEEIELFVDLIIACGQVDRRLSSHELDVALGLVTDPSARDAA